VRTRDTNDSGAVAPRHVSPPGAELALRRNGGGAGSASGASVSAATGAKSHDELKIEKAWALAKSPSSQIFMQLMMMWMSGSAVNIFSIMITFFMLMNPLKAIFGASRAFAPFEVPGVSLMQQKMLYVGINLVVSGFGIYKLWVMGLLPNTDADWVYSLPVKSPLETSFGIAR
jgi:ER membrane protein complex subunit 4